MRLSNDQAGSGPLAFKVMTTNRDRYRVKPTTGVLQPGQDIDVLLILSTSDPLPVDLSSWSKDKFMVKAVAVAHGSLSETEVKERWATASASEVQQVKLGCTHRMPGEAPPEKASPVKAAPSTATAPEPPQSPTAAYSADATAVDPWLIAQPLGRAPASARSQLMDEFASAASSAPSEEPSSIEEPVPQHELAAKPATPRAAPRAAPRAPQPVTADESLERPAWPTSDGQSRAPPALVALLLAHALSSLSPGAREDAFRATCLVLGAALVFVVDRLCSWFCSGGAVSSLCLAGVVLAASARRLVLRAK